jgi:hypothetical protein
MQDKMCCIDATGDKKVLIIALRINAIGLQIVITTCHTNTRASPTVLHPIPTTPTNAGEPDTKKSSKVFGM